LRACNRSGHKLQIQPCPSSPEPSRWIFLLREADFRVLTPDTLLKRKGGLRSGERETRDNADVSCFRGVFIDVCISRGTVQDSRTCVSNRNVSVLARFYSPISSRNNGEIILEKRERRFDVVLILDICREDHLHRSRRAFRLGSRLFFAADCRSQLDRDRRIAM